MSNLERKVRVLENVYNTEEYYQRAKKELEIYTEILAKYSSKEEFVRRKLEKDENKYSSISTTLQKALFEEEYDRMNELVDDHKQHIPKWEAGMRMRLDVNGKIEYYNPENK